MGPARTGTINFSLPADPSTAMTSSRLIRKPVMQRAAAQRLTEIKPHVTGNCRQGPRVMRCA